MSALVGRACSMDLHGKSRVDEVSSVGLIEVLPECQGRPPIPGKWQGKQGSLVAQILMIVGRVGPPSWLMGSSPEKAGKYTGSHPWKG